MGKVDQVKKVREVVDRGVEEVEVEVEKVAQRKAVGEKMVVEGVVEGMEEVEVVEEKVMQR